MAQRTLVATGFAVLILSFAVGTSNAAEKMVEARSQAAAWPPQVGRVRDCSVFPDPYRYRGFGWGSGPDSNLGFGTFEGALSTYAQNTFPNWYGLCRTWGPYVAPGAVR
jgi:hypothetical protein